MILPLSIDRLMTLLSIKSAFSSIRSSNLFLLQLAQLLPMEETFLLLFRFDNPLDSSVEFMKVSVCKVQYDCMRVNFPHLIVIH